MIWIMLVISALLSLWMLILNFKAMRDHYEGIGQQLMGRTQPSASDVPTAGTVHKILKRREGIATALLFVEMVLILTGVVWSWCGA